MSEQRLTVVMYHYVRDLKNSRYPSIKGLDAALFAEQVDYLQRHYNPVTMEAVVAAYAGGAPLPEKAVLLTFDDGYADHFTTVFPILYNRGIQGSFFAPVRAITEHKVLDVNKIHFILASSTEIGVLLQKIEELLDKYRAQYGLDSYGAYYEKLAGEDRYDTPEVLFVKRLLQVELPLEVRSQIVDELFVAQVGMSEECFSRELYMNDEQMRTMIQAGMHIGSHGFDHFWLASLDKEGQRNEIQKSKAFLEEIGVDMACWTICYPYGNYDENTLSLLSEYGCSAGFTTEVAIANLHHNTHTHTHTHTLPRLDTNDIPKDRNAPTNDWWEKG